jgi:hypothetical protein
VAVGYNLCRATVWLSDEDCHSMIEVKASSRLRHAAALIHVRAAHPASSSVLCVCHRVYCALLCILCCCDHHFCARDKHPNCYTHLAFARMPCRQHAVRGLSTPIFGSCTTAMARCTTWHTVGLWTFHGGAPSDGSSWGHKWLLNSWSLTRCNIQTCEFQQHCCSSDLSLSCSMSILCKHDLQAQCACKHTPCTVCCAPVIDKHTVTECWSCVGEMLFCAASTQWRCCCC